MTKPTNTTVRPASPDTLNINRSSSGNSSVNNPGSSGISAPGTSRLPDTPSPNTAGSEVVVLPRVVVSHITDPIITEANARMAEISLPGLQTHLLQPHVSVDGLFVTPDGQTYAHLEEGGHYRVELNTAGDYQIPWPEAPGVTPPILKKIDGQPLWRIEAQWYTAQSRQSNLPARQQSADTFQAMFLVDPHLATFLPAAHDSPDGIRNGPRGNTYIDIADGTVLVRRNAQGEYKLASATTTNVPDITFEQIPGQFVWRRKLQAIADTQQDLQPGSSRALTQPEESAPGPSKRPRLPEDSDPPDPFALMGIREPLKGWGTTEPPAGDSVEIGGKHFAILDQPTHAVDGFAFIKPPQFSAYRFDAFEQLLLTTPELQPKGVVKLADRRTGHGSDTWRVVKGLPFAKSLTQIVSDKFSYLSDDCANKVAQEIFNRANHSGEITGPGINALVETIQYWDNRFVSENRVIRQDLSDPFMLLSPLAPDATGNMHMPLPSAEGLQRIDFDPKLFYGSRHQRNIPSTRTLFKDLLYGHGYNIAHDFGVKLEDALLIKRMGVDHVFIMFMDRVPNNTVDRFDPITWLKKRALANKMNAHLKNNLREHLRTNSIIFLLGVREPLPTHDYNLVVTRHS